ncbi:MAG: trypsin-like peptidase domain-containing protein, partial [Verrucomicrobiota bacterium]
NDLAILKVEQWEGKFLGLAPAAEVGYASEVIAAGFPDPNVLGKNPKISKGIVNALTGVRDDPRFIQMSAPVQPGNSGGPLISNSGRVVGIVAAGLNSMDRMTQGGYLPQTVNFAVKSDLVFPLLKSASVSLPKFGNRTGNPDKQVSRAIEAIALIEGRQGRATASTSKRSALAPPPPQPSPAIDTFSPQGPWIFPYSHARPLAVEEVEPLNREGLWRARNEIYLRRGLVFSSLEGQQFAREFGAAYRPRTISVPDVQRQFTPLEIANLQLISHFEHQPSR